MGKPKTEIQKLKDVNLEIDRAKQEIKDVIYDLIDGKSVFNYHSKIQTAALTDFHRSLLYWSDTTKISHGVKSLILSALYSADEKTAGSGLYAAVDWIGMGSVSDESIEVTSDNIFSIIDVWSLSNSLSNNVAKMIFRAGGAGFPVDILEDSSVHTSINVYEGRKVSGYVDYLFSEEKEINLTGKFSIAVVDGFVETVASIHKFLEEAETNRVVLIARGFSLDVVNTLLVNYKSQKLNVIPYVANITDEDKTFFLDKNIPVISTDIGNYFTDLSLVAEEQISLTNDSLYLKDNNSSVKKISVHVGKDLGPLVGLAKDRIKFLIAIFRFTARSGILQYKLHRGDLLCFPRVSGTFGQMSSNGLRETLENLGCLVHQTNLRKKI